MNSMVDPTPDSLSSTTVVDLLCVGQGGGGAGQWSYVAQPKKNFGQCTRLNLGCTMHKTQNRLVP